MRIDLVGVDFVRIDLMGPPLLSICHHPVFDCLYCMHNRSGLPSNSQLTSLLPLPLPHFSLPHFSPPSSSLLTPSLLLSHPPSLTSLLPLPLPHFSIPHFSSPTLPHSLLSHLPLGDKIIEVCGEF